MDTDQYTDWYANEHAHEYADRDEVRRMHLIGRYERIRKLGPHRDISPPYVLDRKWARLKPYECDEWWRSPDGVWIPTIAGGVGFQGRRASYNVVTVPSVGYTQTGPTTFLLNVPYVVGTSGNAIAHRYYSPGSETVTSMHFFVTVYVNGASVMAVTYEIRTGTGSGPTTTGGGLLLGSTVNPGNTTGWISITGLSQALSAGWVWFIIADAEAGAATNYATVNREWDVNLWPPCHWLSQGYSSTVGFSGGATPQNGPSCIVVGFSSGAAAGMQYSALVDSPNDAYMRGLYIDGLQNSLKIFGFTSNYVSTQFTGGKIFPATEAPNGTALATTTDLYGAGVDKDGVLFRTPPTLAASTAYRVLFTYGGSTNRPKQFQIGTGSTAVIESAKPGGGTWKWTTEATGNAWVEDATKYPDLYLLVEDQVAQGAQTSGLADVGEKAALNILLGDTAIFATVYVGLSTTAINDDGTGITEPSGNGYARVSSTNNATNWPVATGSGAGPSTKSNGTVIQFPQDVTGNWGTITHWFIHDNPSGAGQVIAYGPLTTPLAVVVGDSPRFGIGDLTITLD